MGIRRSRSNTTNNLLTSGKNLFLANKQANSLHMLKTNTLSNFHPLAHLPFHAPKPGLSQPRCLIIRVHNTRRTSPLSSLITSWLTPSEHGRRKRRLLELASKKSDLRLLHTLRPNAS